MNPVTVKENTDYTVLANGFTNEGYTFKGWKVDNGPTILQPGTVINVTANVTLTAQWEKAPTPPTPAKEYTVTFDANEHGIAPEAQTVKAGDSATEPTAPTAEGYTFAGWYTDADGEYKYNFASPVNKDIKLYAKWIKDAVTPEPKDFTIKYISTDENQGTVDPSSETVKVKGGEIKGSEAKAKPGYKFVKWIDTEGNEVSKDEKFVPTERKDATYIAVFEKEEKVTPTPEPKNFTIKYISTDENQGTVSPESETVKVDGGEIKGSEAKAKPGYKFVKWIDTEGNEVSKDEKFVPTERKDATYIAVFEKEEKVTPTPEPKNFTIKYISTDENQGTVSPESETVKVDGGEIKGSEAKAKDGYKFVKWIDTEGNEVSKEAKFVPTERKDATYIAVFEKENTVIPVPTPTPEPSDPKDPKDPTDPKEPNKPDDGRVHGKDRIETAIEISKKYFGQAKTVIVVDRKDFPDAMTASVLSKLLNAPILLTDTNKLDPRVKAEIERLGARDVIIVGGNSSVSEAVKRELAKYDKDTVERIYGKDRYETSAQVARRVVGITGKLGHAVVASGEVFADALAVAPYASREGYPILLVKANNLPKSVKDAITELAINKVTIAGGYSTVNKSLESSLPTVVERLRGNTRYETAIAIADKKFGDSKETFLANGEQWMDALVIGPVGGMLNMPILLTGANSAPQSLRDYIAKSNIEKITAIGGRSMVSDKVLNELSK